jgi:hypothetical protein
MEHTKSSFISQSKEESDRIWLDRHRQERRIRRALQDETSCSHVLVVLAAGVISKYPVYQAGGEA